VPLQKIADAHLMGIAPLEDTDLPLASLGIVLQGIFLAPNNKSIALIQTSDGKMKAYHVGDTLAANVSIVDILKDYVVVKHNGQLARLTMKIMPLDFSKMTSAQGLFS
jgi:type II secretory pathway component PulC